MRRGEPCAKEDSIPHGFGSVLNLEYEVSSINISPSDARDMLGRLGVVDDLSAQGLIAPTLQYRSKREGLIAQFDFGEISDLTNHPYRLQCEQFELTRILQRHYENNPNFRIEFDCRVEDET